MVVKDQNEGPVDTKRLVNAKAAKDAGVFAQGS